MFSSSKISCFFLLRKPSEMLNKCLARKKPVVETTGFKMIDMRALK
jgi:hypothetical protein